MGRVKLQQKALFHLTAKNDIAAGNELITAELRRLAINAVNTPVDKTPADTLALQNGRV